MSKKTDLRWIIMAVLCGIILSSNAFAQTFVRYVKPADLATSVVYSDTVLTSIVMPRGVARLDNYPKFNVAALELARVLEDPDKELLQVWVCGSASPEGLWQYNVDLSQERTDAAVNYLKAVLDIPEDKIHAESLNEDWDRLAELVEASDLQYKEMVLHIIRTKTWGDRKRALQQIDGGRVWKILEKDFFPKLRCVRFAIFCKWDPSRPYLAVPQEVCPEPAEPVIPVPVPAPAPAPAPAPVAETEAVKDTLVIRDTVYVYHERVVTHVQPTPSSVTQEQVREYQRRAIRPVREKKYWDTPWMFGLKTNLIGDALLVPTLGAEVQLGRSFSLDLQGWMTRYNIFTPSDQNTNFYGFSPELRWWLKGDTMRRGSFIGLHGRCAWYTLQWKDGLLYQNGPKDVWDGNYHDSGNSHPAWSAGFTYGYSLGLGRKANWGLEFVIGIGYANYQHNTAAYNGNIWELVEYQDNHHFGITRAAVNLTYRFSVRIVKPEYYQE